MDIKVGSWVWFTESLWFTPIHLKVDRVEKDVSGRVTWIAGHTRDYEYIDGYSVQFSKSKPAVYGWWSTDYIK